MTEKRIQFNNVVQNQLPQYVKEEFPLVSEFLKQYYISQEFQSSPTDIIQNIDQYLKLDTIKYNIESTTLTADISFLDEVIPASNTIGFPDSYGLLQIDDEIITYTSKTSNSFLGCIRGFSGVTAYNNSNKPDTLEFSETESSDHSALNSDGTSKVIINLSSLFLQEFFNKIKYQFTPGFENREFYSSLDKYLFLKQSKDFYSTRGTDLSFKILFNILYGEEVKIIKPQDYLVKPSDAQYQITNDLVVESISGDPYELERSTLNQEPYDSANITKGYASISNVEKIYSDSDKIYYKLSFDAGYNRDIIVDGSLYGNFSIHPKTKLIGTVSSGTNTLDVDSTVGFPLSGDLSVIYEDGTEGIVTYTSKNLNQFFGCQNITKTIKDKSDICLNVYAYGLSNTNSGETIKVRITSVLSNVNIVDDTYYCNSGDDAIIKTLGINPNDSVSNEWIFNIPNSIEIAEIITVVADQTYRLTTKVSHNLRVGDSISILSNDGVEKFSNIISVISSDVVVISGQGSIDLNKTYTAQRILSKVNSNVYSYLSNENTNIQNIYKIDNKTLVASPSLPFYNNQPIDSFGRSLDFTIKKGFIGDTFNVENHNFYTGDSVYYTPGTPKLFDEGVYFIKKVDINNLKLSKSRENIYKNSLDSDFNAFVTLDTVTEDSISNNLVSYDFYSKNLTSQKLLREISSPVHDGNLYETLPGTTGILVNGVEILNYKSKDKIYYNSVEKIDIIKPGSGYDVINPPSLIITDSVGVGATGYCSVSGSLQEIRIIDPGFDYIETPQINITGGNGVGAKASASMKLIEHQVLFNSESQSERVNLTNNTIGFSTYHKFRNAEKVIYRTNAQESVGGISTNSIYYVSPIDLYTIKLHKTFDDALVGVNTVPFTSYGIGNHVLESYNKKSVIASIIIESNGSNYENKKRTVTSTGISTSLGYISITNHGFNSGEIVKYSTNGSVVGGLQNNTNYYITKVDEDNFKLSLVGVSTDIQDFYYKTSQYIRFTSTGSGTHSFNYPEITVEVVGNIGIASTGNDLFKAIVQPIFRGEISSVYLENGGVGYGSSEVINFNRVPNVTLNSGSECQLIPVINNGKIDQVLINNPGKDYNSPPNLTIRTNGSGIGAVLTPILENGQVKSVKIVESGAGYDINNTFITVTPAGSGVELDPKLKTWTVNLFERYYQDITDDDGFIFYNPNSKYGLQYTHLYAPRTLRQNIYSKDIKGKTLYGQFDLKKSSNGKEQSSTNHSPIIGWAYDGNPIYGPYGYSKKNGVNSTIVSMISGYNDISDTLTGRPPLSQFPVGFFVEDYEYKNSSDENILDEYNGRFCVTPDFPKGTYAYFATINNTITEIQNNKFNNYRKPTFPYLIGHYFKSVPNEFNFNRSSNQDDIDLNRTDWSRNTTPYNLLSRDNTDYSYLNLPNSLSQTVNIKYASSGLIESVGIITGGLDYKVNDKIVFDDSDTSGFGFSSKVSRISGKSINYVSASSTTIYNLEIYSLEGDKNSLILQSNNPHNLLNKDTVFISGLSTTSSLSRESYNIGVSTNILAVSNPLGIGSIGVTGISTFISVSGNLNKSNIRENDIYLIGNEKIKVLNIDRKSSRIEILRAFDGTVGSAHSSTDLLYELSRRFSINVGSTTSYTNKVNKEIYFNPQESLGIGTVSGAGIGKTINFSNPGVGITQIFIPTKTIYIPNHNLNTGDELIYSNNFGDSIQVSSSGSYNFTLLDQSKVYAAKINNDLIGISTVKVGLGSTGTFVGIATTTSSLSTLYFTGNGTGTYHSFKTNYNKLSGQVSKNIVTVSTGQTHGLLNGDYIFMDVNPGVSTSIIIKYDDYNRKVLVNPKSFVSAGVNTVTNTITIVDHKFEPGQKVVHTSELPSIGLNNNQIYYVVPFDKDNICLSPSYYSATSLTPNIIGISSASYGTLSAVNPPVKVYRDSTVNFDLSDSSLSYQDGPTSYSAFELNFYLDSSYTQIYEKSINGENIEVVKNGKVGIDSTAKTSLSINSNTPQKLYYKLDIIDSDSLPLIKREVNIDSSVISNNEINVMMSDYNGKYSVISTSSTSFTYNTEKNPEYSYYDTSSSLRYDTTSKSAFGAISKVDILSKGQKYNKLPKFVNVNSTLGTGAILEAFSTSIGKVKKTKINNIGFDFSCDHTVRPNIILPQVLKIDPLNSLEYIGITSVGRGYLTAPNLLVFDGKTKELLSEVDLEYSLGDSYVTILNNTYRLSEVTPIIIPTQNSNGVGISSISYNQSTKDVTATLSVGFSTANSFPFSVNDRVLIENISIGINSTGKGFNSENYNYQLFTVTSVDENLGGYGSVTYNLSDNINGQEFPGTYDEINSSGRIIPEKYFPQFDIKLKSNKFFKNEDVRYVGDSSSIGFVQEWDEKLKYIKISSREVIQPGKALEGLSSKTQGNIFSSIVFEGFINVNAYSKVENGWITDTGLLNNNLQRIQDNFYYQNFSYSLSSRVPYDTWENAVGSLNHTAGFKKFSDYQLETFAYSGIGTDVISNVDVTVDIDGIANLNCFYDFDLASENALTIDSRVLSDEITFSSRVLEDYYESFGNRVLSIDDISPLFNSNPRSTNYAVVHRFYLSDARAQKYITFIRDKRYTSQRQLMILTLLHDDSIGYLNQYARVETVYDLGSFDFSVENNEGLILFYPTNYKVNNYDVTTLAFNLKDNFAGVGSTSLGNIVKLDTNTSYISYGSPNNTIVSVGSSYTSLKVLSEIYSDNGEYQFDELNLVHDGSNIEILNYGQLSTHSYDAYSSSGLGTYYPYFSGSNINIDFVPNVGTAASVSTIQISIANTSMTGIGTFDIRYVRFEARTTSIASSISPTSSVVAEYSNDYYGGYFIVQVSDITNNRKQLSEVIAVNDTTESYFTEFANIETHSTLGTVGTLRNTSSTQLTFTPIPDIQTEVKVFFMSLNVFDITNASNQYNNSTAVSDYAIYYGTNNDIAKSFELKHKTYPIFQRYFDGSSSSVVSIASSTITIPNHFFVTGEKITYSSGQVTALSTPSPIGIASTDFGAGIGITNKLPSSVYVIKIDENSIKLARNVDDALATVPKSLNITSVGIGTSHVFTSQKQNVKSLILIDNIIQNPIVSTSSTTYLSGEFLTVDDILYSDSTTNFYIGDLISINNEIMKIESVGVGSTNSVRVARPWLGTELSNHSIGSTITKINGNYNIVENKIHFTDPPYGKVPVGIDTNSPDERDWNEVSTNSSFQGRTFMRSGIKDTSNESYYKNYIFDDISSQFNGFENTFTLKSNKSNVTDIFTENGIFLINNIFQYPGIKNNYTLGESTGITSISFVGAGISLTSDVNTSAVPSGGVIVSVGSTEGFGYQPLVAAGGTAIVSAAGTISSVSIGNSGSGYRSSIYTLSGLVPVTVRVGVATSSTGIPNIQFIGTATVNNGNIVSIAITNPGIGYTTSNPPYVIIDSPLSYSDIPLVYSQSSSGIGTRATIDIVVGQESKVISFEVKNTGYGYEVGDMLTVPIAGPSGIPTVSNSTIKEFQVSVQSVDDDKFFGWSMGEFQILDDIQRFFDGKRTVYPLYLNSQITSIYARKGSLINIQDTLLVFVNDVLQVPGESYVFNGGSTIKFTEALKPDDVCRILFYKGSGDDVDVIYNDIIETVKTGDDLQLNYDSYSGQSPSLLENPRAVIDILSIDTVETNPYFGPGNTEVLSLSRPINWCKQSEDLVINEQDVTKDRILYEPLIYPTTHLIQPVGVGSTIIFVENLRPFFNPVNENGVSLEFQNNVTFISQDAKVSASATAVVSVAGTISSIVITNGGFGYQSIPNVTIQNSIGIGLTTSIASASITSGIITSISVIGVATGYSQENPPVVLIDPPSSATESDKVISYTGDFGIIAGISTVSVGVASTGIVFDFFIPTNSPLRNSLIAGVTTVSGIQTGYYFVISDSNVGNGVTSLDAFGSIVGSTTSFLDGVYQVSSVSIAQTSVIGIGVTYVAKVTTSVSNYNGLSGIGYSSYFGNYSWGRVFLRSRSKETQYNSYTNNGYLGISTGTIVKRTVPLKYSNYI